MEEIDCAWPVNAVIFYPIHNMFTSRRLDSTVLTWDGYIRETHVSITPVPTGDEEEFVTMVPTHFKLDILLYLTFPRRLQRHLTSAANTRIEIKLFEDSNNCSETLTGAKFEKFNLDLFREIMKPAEQVLKDANVKKGDIDEAILIGDSTRIPKV